MNELAILQETGGNPRAVRLETVEEGLLLKFADGTSDLISWWKLFRGDAAGTTSLVRRVDQPGWELRVGGAANRGWLEKIKKHRIGRFVAPLGWLSSLKVMIGAVVLAITMMQNLPAGWTARMFGQAAQERLVRGPLLRNVPQQCVRPEGIAALKRMAQRLDRDLADEVDIRAFNYPSYQITSLPAGKIIVTREVLAASTPDEVAVLLAHELAHIDHGDPVAATVRQYGVLGAWGKVLNGEDSRELQLEFTGAEEAQADRKAIAMLRRAGYPVAAGADLFERYRVARAKNAGFAYEQRDFHFDVADRVRVWATAARAQGAAASPTSRDDADALFNLCWAGALSPYNGAARPPPPPPGRGQIP